MANYNFKFTHIKGINNPITDCMSRLTRCIRAVPHYLPTDPILVCQGKERADPTGRPMDSEAGMKDTEYLSMIHSIEAGTHPTDLPKDNELKKLEGLWGELSIFTLSDGKTLLLKNYKEILVPAGEQGNIMDIFHSTHLGYESMLLQLRGKVFWRGMREDLRNLAKN